MSDRSDGPAVPRIGWIGVGKMGSPLVCTLLAAGLAVTVLEPVLENRASAVAAGCRIAASAAEIARDSDMVFTTLGDDAALHDLMFGPDPLATALRPGQVLVDMSTISPRLSEDIAAVLANRGVQYLRAPMSGSITTARTQDLTIIVSGPLPVWRRAAPVLALLGSRTFRIGNGEEARYAKLAINVLLGSTAVALGEAMMIAGAGGVDSSTLVDLLCESAVGSPVLRYKRDALADRDFTPAFSVSQMIKDLELIDEVADRSGQALDLVPEIRRRFEQARRAGLAEQDYFVVVRDQLEGGGQTAARRGARSRIRSTSS